MILLKIQTIDGDYAFINHEHIRAIRPGTYFVEAEQEFKKGAHIEYGERLGATVKMLPAEIVQLLQTIIDINGGN